MKKSNALIFIVMILTIFSFTSCSEKQEYVRVEIYSIESSTLLKTIDDAKTLNEIDENVTMGERDIYSEAETIPVEEYPEYSFVFYTKQGNSSEANKDFTLTTYKDSDFILDEFPSETDDVIYRSLKVVQYLRGLL